MDIKLISCVLLVLTLTGCSTHKLKKFEYHFGNEETWINSYKIEVFWGCMQESYKNDTLTKIISKKDFINQPEIIADWDIIEKANEIGKRVSINTPKPIYPKFEEGNKEEFYKKNYFLASCLNYYKSKELDVLAKKEYKKFLEKNKE